MNKRVKKLWIKALTSGKYKQGKHRLKTGEEMCCLGVLCDVYRKEKKLGSDKFWGKKQLDWVAAPDNKICEWAGIKNPNKAVHMGMSLAYLNDNSDYTFDQIAEVIKKKL
jgi:hypothetical protein